jgi:hypothetical protein
VLGMGRRQNHRVDGRVVQHLSAAGVAPDHAQDSLTSGGLLISCAPAEACFTTAATPPPPP